MLLAQNKSNSAQFWPMQQHFGYFMHTTRIATLLLFMSIYVTFCEGYVLLLNHVRIKGRRRFRRFFLNSTHK